LKRIETLLFDLDGTLVDSRRDLANAVNFALESVDQPRQSEEEIVPHVGNGLRILLSEVMGPVPDEMLEIATRSFSIYYDAHCVDHTVLYENVQAVMTGISIDRKIGVVTNKPEAFAQKIIRHFGLSDMIGVIVGGDSLPEKKPHPAPVLKAVRDLGGDVQSAMVVGDGAQDIQAGQAAGLLTCIARYGYGFRSESLTLKPDFQINRFIELKEIMDDHVADQ